MARLPSLPSIRIAALALPLAVVAGCAGDAPKSERREMPYRFVEGTKLYDVLPPDGIPSIDEPVFVSADAAAAFMQDDEPVLGLIAEDGSARCYSAWHLDAHEIVNDTLDGKPIAVTW